jgi:hypothetical protein
MQRLSILFGEIQVKTGKEIKNVKSAIWIEGQTEYKTHKNIFKERAFITKVISSREIGKTNY